MMKNLIIVLVLLCCLSGVASAAEWYHQENADSTSVGSGFLTLLYRLEPEYARDSTQWQLRHGSLAVYNISMNTSVQYNDSHYYLRIYSFMDNGIPLGYSRPQYNNGTHWIWFGYNSSAAASSTTVASTSANWYDGDYSTYATYSGGSYVTCTGGSVCYRGAIYEEGMFWYTGELYDVVFYVRNPYQQYLSGAAVTITRNSDNVSLGTQYTDFAGAVLFELGENVAYTVSVVLDGYENFSDNLTAIESTYALTLAYENANTSQYQGIEYSWTPKDSPLLMNNTYNFTYAYNSSYWSVEGCWFSILDENGTVISTNTTQCAASIGNSTVHNISTTWNNSLTARMTLQLNGTNITYHHLYSLINFTQGDISLANFADSFGDFSGSGFGDFERWIIAIFAIVLITAGVSMKSELMGEPERILLLVWALVAVASVLNLFPMSFLTNAYMAQYGVLLLVSILSAAAGIIHWRLNA